MKSVGYQKENIFCYLIESHKTIAQNVNALRKQSNTSLLQNARRNYCSVALL